jgi:hypothetical protein
MLLLCKGSSNNQSAVAELKNETHDADLTLTTEVANETAAENGDVEMADQCDVVIDGDINDEKHVCSAALATRIHRVLEMNILPQLHKCLTKEVCLIFWRNIC